MTRTKVPPPQTPEDRAVAAVLDEVKTLARLAHDLGGLARTHESYPEKRRLVQVWLDRIKEQLDRFAKQVGDDVRQQRDYLAGQPFRATALQAPRDYTDEQLDVWDAALLHLAAQMLRKESEQYQTLLQLLPSKERRRQDEEQRQKRRRRVR